jgi:hypothetical protein
VVQRAVPRSSRCDTLSGYVIAYWHRSKLISLRLLTINAGLGNCKVHLLREILELPPVTTAFAAKPAKCARNVSKTSCPNVYEGVHELRPGARKSEPRLR